MHHARSASMCGAGLCANVQSRRLTLEHRRRCLACLRPMQSTGMQAAWTPYEAALARRTKFTVAGTLAKAEKRQPGSDDRSAWLFRFRCSSGEQDCRGFLPYPPPALRHLVCNLVYSV